MYSVLDLCEIFDINPNSFPSLAKRLNLNEESQILKNDYQAKKRYYNQKAFEMLVDYFKKKNKIHFKHTVIALDNKSNKLKLFSFTLTTFTFCFSETLLAFSSLEELSFSST